MSIKKLFFAFSLVLFSSSIFASSVLNIKSTKSRYRFDYELVKVSASEDMGMLGIYYDFFPFQTIEQFYLGIGSLGALHGERGGFFTGGLSAGWLQPIVKNHMIDIGAHLAGGGGADAFPGNGMILRTHVGYEYLIDDFSLRTGIAQTKFIQTTNPNDTDTHPYFGISFSNNFINSFLSKAPLFSNSGYSTTSFEIAPAMMTYSPKDNIYLRSGSKQDQTAALLGMQVNWFNSSSNLYGTVGFYGAGNGGIDGYATVLGGLGWRHKLTRHIYLDAKGMIGMGGGGDVDTGGGLYYQPMLGAGFILSKDFSLNILAGQTLADDGGFEANTLLLALNWTPNVITPNSNNTSLSGGKYDSVNWRAFVDHKTYLPSDGILDKNGQPYEDSINLLGFGIEKPITKYISLSGRGYGAWTGDVGAYAEGLFGVQVHTANLMSNYDLQLEARYDIGVAGGGGMEVGDGVINQLIAGVRYQLIENMFVRAEYGKMQAVDGTFDADTIVLGVDWEFGMPIRK